MTESFCMEYGHMYEKHHDGFCEEALCSCREFRGDPPQEDDVDDESEQESDDGFDEDPYVLGDLWMLLAHT